MRRWEEDTCVRFIERPPGDDSSYVYIFRGSGYASTHYKMMHVICLSFCLHAHHYSDVVIKISKNIASLCDIYFLGVAHLLAGNHKPSSKACPWGEAA